MPLSTVVSSYADGPGLLSELIQNADDAGATTVSFCLDEREHGTTSLLGGRLADWQGPSLLAHNDALFAPSDFEASASNRVGASRERRS